MTSLLTSLLSSDWKSTIKKLLLWAIIPLVAWYISLNWYQLMLIQGSSMEPAYHHLQLVVLNKNDRQFLHGDVVAFWSESLSCVLVKRIVAIPGDTVTICDGTLFVNDSVSKIYDESVVFSYAGILDNKITLREGEYLALGDNTEESKDCRYPEVGIISETEIYGRVGFRR